jgi:hypothetical protein
MSGYEKIQYKIYINLFPDWYRSYSINDRLVESLSSPAANPYYTHTTLPYHNTTAWSIISLRTSYLIYLSTYVTLVEALSTCLCYLIFDRLSQGS